MSTPKRLLVPLSVVMGVALFTSACAGGASQEPAALPGQAVNGNNAAGAGDGSEGPDQGGGNGLFQNGVAGASSVADDAIAGSTTTTTASTEGETNGTASESDSSADESDQDVSDQNDSDSGSTATTAGSGGSDATSQSTSSTSSTDSAPKKAAPVIDYWDVSKVTICKTTYEVSNQSVTAKWGISHADSVYIAIDNEYGPYESGLPTSGTLELPGPGCSEPNVYYLVAENQYGRTVKSVTRTGVPIKTDDPDPPKDETPAVAPKVSSYSVSEVKPCETAQGPQPGEVTVQWNIVGADEIYIAIGYENGVYQSGLPASGSLKVSPPNCQESNTYYIVAINSHGRTVKQQTRTANVVDS